MILRVRCCNSLSEGEELSKRSGLVSRVAQEIRAGYHGDDGAPFMSVRQFAARYGTSLVTAHMVIRDLKREGWLGVGPGNRGVIRRKGCPASASVPYIGMTISSPLSPHLNSLAHEIRRAAEASGYMVLSDSTEYDVARERQIIERFLDLGVVGLIATPGLGAESEALYRELIERGVALVLVGREMPGVNVDCITADHFAGGAAVARHFIEMGYESFGYIGYGRRLKTDMRLNGFRSGLCEEGYDLPAANIVDDNGWDIPNGYRAMAKLVSNGKIPRAIMAFNDLPAIGALMYCREHGIDVPGDVAIAGFDNLPETEVTQPPLTTVEYPHAEVGKLAVQTLLDIIRSPGKRIGTCRRLRPQLVVRGSSDPRAGEMPVVTQRRRVYATWG